MQQEGGEVERPSFLLNGDSGPYANRSEHAHRPDQRRKDEVARIVELQRQLKYAGSVRANYEQQLHQLSQALQNERERKGEDSLKLHQLFEELQELRNHKDALEEQAQHWRIQAETALNSKASSSSDRGQSSIPDEVLEDMKNLQQGEAYWRQQARALLQQYEQAEGDVQRMMRDLQYGRYIIQEKDETEHHLRQEVEYLQAVLHSNTISGDNSRSQSQTWDAESMSRQLESSASDVNAGTPRLLAAFHEGRRRQTTPRHGSETGSELDLNSLHPTFAKIAEQQMQLLREGKYEEAEQLSLNFPGNMEPSPDRTVPVAQGAVRTNGSLRTPRVETASSPFQREATASQVRSRSPIHSPGTGAAQATNSPRPAVQRSGIQQKTDMLLQQLYRDVDTHLERARDFGMRASPSSSQLGRSIATDRSSLNISASSNRSRKSPSMQIPDLQEPQRFGDEASYAHPKPDARDWEAEESARRAGALQQRLQSLPASTPPPFRAKLALENRLAAGIQRTAPDHMLPWEMRVTVLDANNLPTKGRLGGGMFCCVSLLPADTNISSQRYDAIKHLVPDPKHGDSSGLVAQDRILRVMALESTSTVRDSDSPEWDETVVLQRQHCPIQGSRQGRITPVRSGFTQELSSQPCLLLVSVHCTGSKKSTHQMGRTAIMVQGKGTHQQSYTLLRGSGKPAMGASGQLSSVRIQYAFGPVHDHSQEPPRAAELHKPPSRVDDVSALNSARGGSPGPEDTYRSQRSNSVPRSRVGSPPLTVSDSGGSGPRPPPRSSSRSQRQADRDRDASEVRGRQLDGSVGHVRRLDVEQGVLSSHRRARSVDPGEVGGEERSAGKARRERRMVVVTRQGPKGSGPQDSKVGIGISFGVTRGGHTYITGLSPNGPGRASGQLREGDQLLAVDGVDIQGWKVTEIVKLILGKPGTHVRLEILAGGVSGAGDSPTQAPRTPVFIKAESPSGPRIVDTSPQVSRIDTSPQVSRFADTSPHVSRVVDTSRERTLSPDGTYARLTATGQTRHGVIA